MKRRGELLAGGIDMQQIAWLVVFIATIGTFGAYGCRPRQQTALKILDSHAQTYLECMQLRTSLGGKIEQDKQAIRERMSAPRSPPEPIDMDETGRLLQQVSACESRWKTAVSKDLESAGISKSARDQAISEWMRGLQ